MKTSRKQRNLFRKSLNKIYPHFIFCDEDNGIANETLYAFRRNRKTFKLGIRPIEKKKKQKAA